MPQLLEHQGAREHRGDWVRDPFASERGRRAVHWLEQAGPARVKVGARREAEPAHEPGAQVRENISVEIVRDDHLEPLGLAHQLHRQCVHVAVLRLDPSELGGDPPERLLPDPVRRYGIGLVAHGDAGFPVRPGPLERRPDDALDPRRRIDLLGDVVVPRDAAASEVYAFRVLAKDDEVDATVVAAQRREIGVEQPHWAEIDVQVELEAQAEQNVAGVLVPGDSGVADRPEEDRVHVVAQVVERRFRERLARREIMIGAVGEALEIQPESVLGGGLLDRPERRLDHLGPDPVSRDHRDAMIVFHSKPVARPQLTQ